MKRRRLVWAGIVSALAAQFFLTSSVTCSCEPPVDTIGGQMEVFAYPGHKVATVERNQTLGRQAFIGRQIDGLPLRNATFDPECSFVNPRQIDCEYLNEIGAISSTGRGVTIRASEDGKVNDVNVRWIVRFGVMPWLGQYFQEG